MVHNNEPYGLSFSKDHPDHRMVSAIAEAFSIDKSGPPGLDRRRINEVPNGLVFVKQPGADTTLAFDYWHPDDSPSHAARNPRVVATKAATVAGGWSEEGFLASARRSNPAFDLSSDWLGRIDSAIRRKDCAIATDLQGELNVIVPSLTPDDIVKRMRDNDADSDLVNGMLADSGLLEKMAPLGVKITPRLNSDRKTFLIHASHPNGKFGWFTPSELSSWVDGYEVNWVNWEEVYA